MLQYQETCVYSKRRDSVFYEPPAVRYRGALNDLLRRLVPDRRTTRPGMDRRITKLLDFIESQEGRVGWNLDHVCQELRLNMSGPYAARLFKRCTGLGVRDYAKKKRLLLAAERLEVPDLPVKVIAAEFGYRSVAHFSRRFREEFRLSPTEFRKRRAA